MIHIEGVSRRWGDFALQGISLSLEPGEYCAIVGPCGSGKSLMLETIAGLHPPHEGRVWLGDQDVTAVPPEGRQLGYVPQRASIFPHMPVRENIAYGLRYHGVSGREAQQRIEEAIELLAIRAIARRRDPGSLSGGEAQKVVLARSLAIRPRALLLDEPLGSLDYQSCQEVSSALADISDKLGVTVIHVTHDYTEAASLADTVGVMRDGALVHVGSVEEVFWRPNSRFVAEFVGVDNVLPAQPVGDGQVMVGNLRWRTTEQVADGDHYATVRPRDIVVGDDAHGMANEFTAQVTSVADEGFSLRVRLRTDGPELVASVPKRPHGSSGLVVGTRVTAGFAAEAVHLFPADQE
jgi:ABC-type Fe3+/spermidine/putrescine transport system ATPase subunit